jgi:hypothetical protein
VAATKIRRRSNKSSSGNAEQKQKRAAAPATPPFDTITNAKSDPWKAYAFMKNVGTLLFRPGGIQASHQLHEWSNLLGIEQTALELSTGIGTSGMALAKARQCSVVLSVNDISSFPGRYQIARKKSVELFMDKLVMDDIQNPQKEELEGLCFDAVLMEGSLTPLTYNHKEQLLQQLHPHTDQLLLHSVALKQEWSNSDTSSDNSTTSNSNSSSASAIEHFYPLTERGWKQLLLDCGYHVTHVQCGPLAKAKQTKRMSTTKANIISMAKNLLSYLMHWQWRDAALAANKAVRYFCIAFIGCWSSVRCGMCDMSCMSCIF